MISWFSKGRNDGLADAFGATWVAVEMSAIFVDGLSEKASPAMIMNVASVILFILPPRTVALSGAV